MPNNTSTALATTPNTTKATTKAATPAAAPVAAAPTYSHAAGPNTAKRPWAPKANTVPGAYVLALQAAGKAGVPYATMCALLAACPTAKAHSVGPLAKWLAANRGIGSMCANGIITLL